MGYTAAFFPLSSTFINPRSMTVARSLLHCHLSSRREQMSVSTAGRQMTPRIIRRTLFVFFPFPLSPFHRQISFLPLSFLPISPLFSSLSSSPFSFLRSFQIPLSFLYSSFIIFFFSLSLSYPFFVSFLHQFFFHSYAFPFLSHFFFLR